MTTSHSLVESLLRVIALLLLAVAPALAQPADFPADLPSDSTWAVPDSSYMHPDSAWTDTEEAWRELESMNPNDIDFNELLGDISRGWFPRAHGASALSIFGETFYADLHDRGSELRSSSFVPTTASFGWRNPFDDDEREILEANSDEAAEDGYPVTDYTEYGVGYTYNLPMPLVLRAGASLQITEGMLFAHDTSRSFLALSGSKKALKEVGVAYLKNYALTAAGGVNIPFYGVFVNAEFGTLASYYYVYLGASASYVIASRATQYQQIATPKSELRYGNGSDTLTLISRRRLDGLERVRTAIDVALGWTLTAEFFAFSFEAFLSIPQSYVLSDTPWRQFYGGLRTSIGYQWVRE
jgi:hypothetical protein